MTSAPVLAPAGRDLLVLLALLAVAAPVWLAWIWDRLPAGRPRLPLRACGVLLCALAAVAAATVAVNRQIQIFTTWTQVGELGRHGKHYARRVPGPAAPTVVRTSRYGSQLVRWTVHGRRTGLSLPAYTYLPAGYRSAPARRFPVVQIQSGFPGSPLSWLNGLSLQKVLDGEIAAGRMAPTVVVLPEQNLSPLADSECVDAAGGPPLDTYLSADVRDAVAAAFQVRTDRGAWGLLGYSTGGYCAVNLAVRHPDRYAAAASLSGYFTPVEDSTTGTLYRTEAARRANSPLWRATHGPPAAVAVYLAAARDDRRSLRQLRDFAHAARPPLTVTTAVVTAGGHTFPVWRSLEPAALDWLSARLTGPR